MSVRFLLSGMHPRLPHLPRLSRAIRHASALGVGVCVMLAGSMVAACAPHGSLVAILVDACGYFLHGLGAVPFIAHVEPLYSALVAAEEL
jgi:hypothetical protein